MKVVLTGAGGMLGHDLQRSFKDAEVVGFRSASLDAAKLDAVVGRIGHRGRGRRGHVQML